MFYLVNVTHNKTVIVQAHNPREARVRLTRQLGHRANAYGKHEKQWQVHNVRHVQALLANENAAKKISENIWQLK